MALVSGESASSRVSIDMHCHAGGNQFRA